MIKAASILRPSTRFVGIAEGARRLKNTLLKTTCIASIVGIIACFASPAVAQEQDESAPGRAWVDGDFLHIEVGDYHVQFWKNAAWTICSTDYRGKPVLIRTGAYQSVLKVRGQDGEGSRWIGTGHGGEELRSVTLEVDGAAHDVEAGLAATGAEFTVVKVSDLGPYRHTTRVSVSNEGIVEDFNYAMQDEPVDLALMYAFMHCFTNETQHWIAGLGDGQEAQGVFTDDNSFTLKEDIRWALVYAPSTGVGMAYAYPEVYTGLDPLHNAFWNRPRDNKLYLSVMPSQESGATFNYKVRLKAFTASEGEWESAGREALDAILNTDDH